MDDGRGGPGGPVRVRTKLREEARGQSVGTPRGVEDVLR
jgi:hypothetical protein